MEKEFFQTQNQDVSYIAQRRKGRLQMLALFLVCIIPVILSYSLYYFVDPKYLAKSNYGTFVIPQKPIPSHFMLEDLQGKQTTLKMVQDKHWLLITVSDAKCDENCATRLFNIRQARALQSKERMRIKPIWLVIDDGSLNPKTVSAYTEVSSAFQIYRVRPEQLNAWLGTPSTTAPQLVDEGLIYMVDPLGNLMMTYPKDLDFKKFTRDIIKLLKRSRIG